jgi:hypothetical protein
MNGGPHRFWRSNSFSLKHKSSVSSTDTVKRAKIFPGLGDAIDKYGLHNLPRRISERQREKRSQELRQKISAPREVRDGVGDVIRRNSYRDILKQARESEAYN